MKLRTLLLFLFAFLLLPAVVQAADPLVDLKAGAASLVAEYALVALGTLLAAGWAWTKRKLRLDKQVDAFLTVGVNHIEPRAKVLKAESKDGMLAPYTRENLVDQAIAAARERAKESGQAAVLQALDKSDVAIRAKVVEISQKLKGWRPA